MSTPQRALILGAGQGSRLLPLPDHEFSEFIEIAIVDNGIGIADLDEIFQAFTQIDSLLARARGGPGLGLIVVKEFAELHGGTVAVSTIAGQGSTFVVWLPLRDMERAGTTAHEAVS